MNPIKMNVAISFCFLPPVQMTVRSVPVARGLGRRRNSRALHGYGVTPVFRQTKPTLTYYENPV
jgi:hypothetical protein